MVLLYLRPTFSPNFIIWFVLLSLSYGYQNINQLLPITQCKSIFFFHDGTREFTECGPARVKLICCGINLENCPGVSGGMFGGMLTISLSLFGRIYSSRGQLCALCKWDGCSTVDFRPFDRGTERCFKRSWKKDDDVTIGTSEDYL